MQAVARDDQHKPVGYFELAGYLYRGSGCGKVANQAIDCAAAERNRSGFQDAMARGSPAFDHEINVRKITKESIKPVTRRSNQGREKCANGWITRVGVGSDSRPSIASQRTTAPIRAFA
jgi:hypothetical protein